MNVATELRTANTMLETGIPIKVRMPVFFGLFKKTIRLTLSLPTGGTLLRVTKAYLSMGIDDARLDDLSMSDVLALNQKHAKTPALILAHGVLNNKLKSKLFSKLLAGWFFEGLAQQTVCMLSDILLLQGGIKDFMNTIRLAKDLKMTTPNVSQMNPTGS